MADNRPVETQDKTVRIHASARTNLLLSASLVLAVILAAKRGDLESLKKLIRDDCDFLEARDGDGSTPLHCTSETMASATDR